MIGIEEVGSHKPLIISTGISLAAILIMAFYLGSKTETLQVVRDNQLNVSAKLDYLVNEQQKRDLDIVTLQVRMEALHEAVASIQVDIVGIQNDLKKKR
jgi:hypothetical protein